MANQDLKVLQALGETQGKMEHQVLKVHQVRLDMTEKEDHQVLQDQEDSRLNFLSTLQLKPNFTFGRVFQEFPVIPDNQAKTENRAYKVLRVCPVL